MTTPLPIQTNASARDFVDALLSEQKEWTAVDQFSKWHDQEADSPQRESYQRLIPLARPSPGQQYAFEVDLDKCSGCKACVAACHALNGLEETETWREVGLLVGAPGIQQHVTTACHHCADPGCLNGCPVLAYDKDPLTGIVRHLDDQCIGCQYCIMKCPYDVPRYSSRLGIVRKCDMCYQRLAVGEPPACVQACPTEAIRITTVNQADLHAQFRSSSATSANSCLPGRSSKTEPASHSLLPDSPDPALTLPATRFRSRNPLLSTLAAADKSALHLEPAHWPLVFMLVFTQAAAGLMISAWFMGTGQPVRIPTIASALALLLAGIAVATLHLGRPLKAWRGFLGWRTSWLSRELLVLHACAGMMLLALLSPTQSSAHQMLVGASALLGLVVVFSSAMVYTDTGRPSWKARLTFGNFLGSAFVLGTSSAAVLLAAFHEPLWVPMLGLSLAGRATLFVWRELEYRNALVRPHSAGHKNARTALELCRGSRQVETVSFLLGAVCCLLACGHQGDLRILCIALSALAAFAGEVICRYVFFVASAGKGMPGVVVT